MSGTCLVAKSRESANATTAVLLMNLGTPASPTTRAVRRYLSAFLSDRRVVDLPHALWLPLLHLFILNTRARRSARKYAKIWLDGENGGSPLQVYTAAQAAVLQEHFQLAGRPLQIAYAMRYGKPSLDEQMDKLLAQGTKRLLLLPLYPQYASSTTASCVDALCASLKKRRNQPEFRLLRDYHDHPQYIAALASSVRRHWQKCGGLGDGGRLLMSFHGLPQRHCELGDTYYDECLSSARLLATELGIAEQQYALSFQSRFGWAKWLQPSTISTLSEWGKQRLGRVDVLCPGFACDCLETLEEIAIEARQCFLSNGGAEYHYIPAMNADPRWISALAAIVGEQLDGW